jgi:hypothetical protein
VVLHYSPEYATKYVDFSNIEEQMRDLPQYRAKNKRKKKNEKNESLVIKKKNK